jgi:hypothetical protein
MSSRRITYISVLRVALWLAGSRRAASSEYRGRVKFGDLPVLGATVTATQGAKNLTTITNQQYARSDQRRAVTYSHAAERKARCAMASVCNCPVELRRQRNAARDETLSQRR